MDENYDVGKNKLMIDIIFNITKDPNTLSSVQIQIDGSKLGGGDF